MTLHLQKIEAYTVCTAFGSGNVNESQLLRGDLRV